MARYYIYLSAKFDPISYGAIHRLADAWEEYKRDGRPNISAILRKAIIYTYLVLVEGIDPIRASVDIENYIEEKLTELGLEGEQLMRGRKKTSSQLRPVGW